jgi:uncharacterized protein YkwD
MSEPLKLTEEDIERVLDQVRDDPPAPAVISIGLDEVASRAPQVSAPLIRITEDDLTATPPQTATTPNLIELETLMFGLVNSARQAHLPRWLGGPNLRWSDELAAVARGHSVDMLRRGYVDHTSPEGVKVAKRIDSQGIPYVACGENIGVVYGSASHSDQGIYEIHKAFMNQPRRLTNHRGNLLNPIWTHVGIGAAYDENGTLMVTQNFISRVG